MTSIGDADGYECFSTVDSVVVGNDWCRGDNRSSLIINTCTRTGGREDDLQGQRQRGGSDPRTA
jgi:hypothetical protein